MEARAKASLEMQVELQRQHDAAQKEKERERQAAVGREIARKKVLEAKLAALTGADYEFQPLENPQGKKPWLIGLRQPDGSFAFDALDRCKSEPLKPDRESLSWPAQPVNEFLSEAITVPASSIQNLRAQKLHLPRTWTLIARDGRSEIDMSGLASIAELGGSVPCLSYLTKPRVMGKSETFLMRDFGNMKERAGLLAIATSGETAAEKLQIESEGMYRFADRDSGALIPSRYMDAERLAMNLLRKDPKLGGWRKRIVDARASPDFAHLETNLLVAQYFNARTRAIGNIPESLISLGYETAAGFLWVIARREGDTFVATGLQSSPGSSGMLYGGGMVYPEILATVDIDGDGLDELVVLAAHYEGGQVQLIKIDNFRWREIGSSAYRGH